MNIKKKAQKRTSINGHKVSLTNNNLMKELFIREREKKTKICKKQTEIKNWKRKSQKKIEKVTEIKINEKEIK